jgi:leader peptidase (prepilin peptidase)/N-methyltransferase
MAYVLIGILFVVGLVVGSFLNVCIHRLPYEKSILWPLGSRCGTCFKPIAWYDNLPLVSYLVLRGRCRMCGARFSPGYFAVELLTGLCFAGLFYLEAVQNVHDLPAFRQPLFGGLLWFPQVQVWIIFAVHASLVCFLIIASFVDLEHFEIPLPVTVTGTVVGLICATMFPWPWPDPPPPPPLVVPNVAANFWQFVPVKLPETHSLYAWPPWWPLPQWLQPGGNWQTGLVTGLAGMLAGMLMLRVIRFVFGLGRGKEGLGIGDADLMMMAGAFIGWQPIVVAFFVSVFPALLVGVGRLIVRGNQEMPFGPSLAIGILITMLAWQWIDPLVRVVFFTGPFIAALAGGCVIVLLISSFAIRIIRR